MLIKVCFFAIVIFGTVNCQYARSKRQGTKGGRVVQQTEYEPQEPVRRPVAAVAAPVRTKLPQVQEEEPQINVAGGEAAPEPPVYGGVMGTPGVDFPAYGQIPKTSFRCSDVPYEPGMYADEETQCQAYHVCFQGRKESFLCGVGTVFNQAILSCDYWHSVDCASSSKFYSVNEELGKGGAEPGPGGQQPQQPQPQRPISQVRPIVRPPAQRPVPAPVRPSVQQPSEQDQDDYDVAPAPLPAPRPVPRPSVPSKTRPAPIQRPVPVAPVPRPVPAPRPVPVAPAPRPAPIPRPAPVRPSKTQPRPAPVVPRPAPIPAPAPRPIVQTQEEDQSGSEYETY